MSPTLHTAATEDLSTLSWVYDELRRSLEAAHKALYRYLKEAEAAGASDVEGVDPAILRQARTQVHQSVGALELVGLGVAAQPLRAAEAALVRMAAKPKLITPAAVRTIEQGSFALLDYLGRRLAGKPVATLAMFAQYRALQELAGASRIHPADLWAREWQWREVPADPQALACEADASAITEVEAQLLPLMRGGAPTAARRMSAIFASLGCGADAHQSTLWNLAAAYFEGVADGCVPIDVYGKRVASRLLAQMRAGRQSEPSDRLAHDLLFFCAQARADGSQPMGPRLQAVRAAYELTVEPPVDYEVPSLGRFDPAWVTQARKRVAAAKECWSAVAAGEMARLPGLNEPFALVGDSLQRLYAEGEVLSRALQAAAAQTLQSGREPGPDLAMEVATALLYLDASLEDGDFDHPEMAQRVQRLAQRIDDVRMGRDPGALERWMEELYRRVSDRQTMGSVVQELRSSLSDVEKQIDQYFRSPTRRELLIPVPAQLSAMRGVLSVLGLDQASQAVVRMRDDVDALANTEIDAERGAPLHAFNQLADNLGALSFLIDMVSVQPSMAKSLFRFDAATGRLTATVARAERASDVAEAPLTVSDADTLVERAQSLVTASAEPDADVQRITQDLERLSQQARAADEPALAEAAHRAQAALAHEGTGLNEAARRLSESITELTVPLLGAAPPLPMPEPVRPVPPASAPVAPGDTGLEEDLEMREIFLEEAREVIDGARSSLVELQDRPGDAAALTTVRRAFHTLKGSSRMVGLREFGEAAWACEQLYNARLADSAPADGNLRGFSSEVLDHFEQWVDAIALGQAGAFRHEPVTRCADALRLDGRRLSIGEALTDGAALAQSQPAAEPAALAETVDLLPESPAVPAVDDQPVQEQEVVPADSGSWVESGAAAVAHPEPLLLDLPELTESLEPVIPTLVERIPDLPQAEDLDLRLPSVAEAPLPLAEEPTLAWTAAPAERTSVPAYDAIEPTQAWPRPEVEPEVPTLIDVPPSPSYESIEPTLALPVLRTEDSVPAAAAELPVSPAPDESARDGFVHTQFDLALPADIELVDAADARPSAAPLLDVDFDEPSPGIGGPGPEPDPGAAPVSGGAPLEEPVVVPTTEGVVDENTAFDLIELDLPEVGPAEAVEVQPLFEPDSVTAQPDVEVIDIGETIDASAADAVEAPSAPVIDLLELPSDLDAGGADQAEASEAGAPVALPVEEHSSPTAPAVPSQALMLTNGEGLPEIEPAEPSDLADLHASEQVPAEEEALDAASAAEAQEAAATADGAALRGDEALRPAEEDVEQVKVIGDLRISIPLFNIYLNEADELSRKLVTALAEWSLEPHRAVGDQAVALAHSLAGSSATVGYLGLSHLARSLEHCLLRSHDRGHARGDESTLFPAVADEIRRLLHQFAAGFLKPADADLVERLAAVEHAPSEPVTGLEDAAERAPEPTSVLGGIIPTAFGDLGQPALMPFTPLAPTEPERATTVRVDALDSDEDIDAVDAIDDELFPIFEEEGQELIPQLQARLRDWMRRPGEPGAAAACMRTLHTLKGGARLAGAMRLGEMAHRLETAIEHLLANGDPTADAIEPLVVRADVIEAQFDALRRGEPAPSHPAAAATLDLGPATEPGALDAAPEWTASQHGELDELARAAEPLPLAAVAAQLQTAGAHVEPEAAADSAAPSSQPTPAPEPIVVREIDWSRFDRAAVAAAAGDAPRGTAAAHAATVRVRAPLLDRLVNHAGEVSITRSRIESDVGQIKTALSDLTDNLERLRAQLRDIELQAETQIGSRMEAARAAALQFDPLEMDRFTRFQELTRMMAESVNDVATVQRGLQRTLQSAEDELAVQSRLTRDMQEDLLRTRMVEFESQSERLYRVVRQAAKETGKQVRLDIVGGSIEVDRGVLDRMTGSFEHLLRNSVAHGIESPQARQEAGKDPVGSIVISVSQEGNEVGVDFRDDGAGLNLQRIRERGVAMGLLAADAPATDAELAAIIFHSGFSTAESVTGLAGRGVGMDVVRADVNAMGGRIETATAAGQGTSFKLVLPLTTAVTQVVMLRCAGLTVAVPSTLVEIVRRMPVAELDAAYRQGTVHWAEHDVPFFWLGALLQGTPLGHATGKTAPVVVIRSAAQRVVLHVDEVIGNQEVVVKNLGPQLSRLPGLTGMTLLPSGQPALIYNPVALATLYGATARAATVSALEAARREQEQQVQQEEAVQAPLVLVVDDSLTVRRVTQRLLQREGYRVSLAKDGLEGLERLADELPAVVLTDIEMPRMDGFDLVRNMRVDERLNKLPIIMITSRIAQKHRDYAAELGVNHYLGKPFAEEELLALVANYARVAVPA
ncbi:MAG: Hpt domain-containing protein [Burkholderiaceae bacterium]|nr:Hpt domain-containing protein [Aquabacterium sp.]NUP84639.1 Hpt domain-containing protein [Burkholderiaceae bacterium]